MITHSLSQESNPGVESATKLSCQSRSPLVRPIKKPQNSSSASRLSWRIERGEFDAGIVQVELPFCSESFLVSDRRCKLALSAEFIGAWNAIVEVGSMHGCDLGFGDVEPTAVGGSVMALKSLCQLPGFVWRKGFVK